LEPPGLFRPSGSLVSGPDLDVQGRVRLAATDRVLDVAAGPKGSFYVAGNLRRAGHYEDAALVRFSVG
jgi:hypothetical protein